MKRKNSYKNKPLGETADDLTDEVTDALPDNPQDNLTDDPADDLSDDLTDDLTGEATEPDGELDAYPDDDITDKYGTDELYPQLEYDPELKALPAGGDRLHLLPKLSDKSGTRDNLHLYLREISRFSLLEAEEETALARRVRDTGDPDAAFRLVSSHLRLVVRIAMDFQRRWMQNVLDLIQEGNVGLVRAVSKFDPEKGIKFSYYAAFWIKAYILKFIMDNWRMVKIGTTQAQRKLFYNLNKERQRLIAQGFDPDAAALSKSLNVTEDQIIEMEQRMDATDMSLNLPMNSDEPGGATRMDYLPALGPGIEDTLANNQIADMVQAKLQTLIPSLSDKEQYIISHRLLTDDPVTLREIGEKYNITRERVRQIEARLLQKIRDHLFSNIKDFSQDWINPQ
ncbi:MAG: RNA polymerase factor sigma-32 [Deltaproteobacteria bacterium]|jgi:RNA polymerase sigma-32 factor|nr:RNA polymerase factor sigma-32 [Deltaproteobacteria bacterium]